MWDIEAQVITNPLLSLGGGSGDSDPESGPIIDATTDAGIDKLESLGLPVKRI